MSRIQIHLALASMLATLSAACLGDSDTNPYDGPDQSPPIGEGGQTLLSASGAANLGNYWNYPFTKQAGWRYTVCIDVTLGNGNLYGHYTGYPTAQNYQFASTNTGTKSDCFSFTASASGNYYLSVLGAAAGTNMFTLRISANDNTTIPTYLSGQLKRPNACTTPIDKYGPFNAPWGNPSFSPFYDFSASGGKNYKNYIHNGVDYLCAAGTAVKAVCTGPVTKVGDLGTDPYGGTNYWWGKYVVQECAIGSNKVTIAYDHLDSIGPSAHTQSGSPPQTVGTVLTKGTTVVGSIAHLTLPGEADHLHLGVCAGAASSCTGLQGGASQDTAFPPPLFLNPDVPGLWGP